MAAIWEGKGDGLIPVWVEGPMQMASRTNAAWGVAGNRASPASAEPPALLLGSYCRGKPPAKPEVPKKLKRSVEKAETTNKQYTGNWLIKNGFNKGLY